MSLSVLHLSAVLMVMPLASGQAADLLLNQSISHGAVELTPVSARHLRFEVKPIM